MPAAPSLPRPHHGPLPSDPLTRSSSPLLYALADGAAVLVVERNINAPEYDERHLVSPADRGPKPVPGDKAALIKRGGRNLDPGCYLELCQCRDLDYRKLPNLDYAHFSPNCLSVSTTGKNLRSEPRGWLETHTDL